MQATWERAFGISRPEKIICVGLNYDDHAKEGGQDLPTEPLLFAKFSNTVIDNGETIRLPQASTHVDAEAELAIVIGRQTQFVAAEDALDFVYGYAVANDVSARDLQFRDGQWFRGKGFDTFCPLLGTVVPTTEFPHPADVRVTQRLNGELLQDARTSALIFDIPTLVAHISSVVTLCPGDVILTGTPEGVGYFRDPKIPLAAGDLVEVEVEGIGTLTNPVQAFVR